MIRSLRFRLFFAGAALVAIALAAIWVTLSDLFSRQIAREYERQLVAIIDTLAANIEISGGDWRLAREPADPRYLIPASGQYWQLAGPGKQTLRSRSLWDSELNPAQESTKPLSGLIEMTGPDANPVIALSQPITFGEAGKEITLTAIAATSRAEFDRAVADFSSQLGMMLAVTGLALVSASALQVFLGLLPLADLRSNVAKVRSGAAARMPEHGPSETQPLVREINNLLAAQEKTVAKARQRAADLAHGLKTPLTVLAQIADRLSEHSNKKTAEEMHEQVSIIRQRVDRQLALSRMAAARTGATDVSVAAGKLISVMQQISHGSFIEWTSRLPEGLVACADPTDFSEAMGNVLDNARKWAVSHVKTSAFDDGCQIAIAVEDDGPGVPEADWAHILERGRRLDTHAGETGLGLAICGEIAEAYGGSVEIGRSSLGGLRVTLRWPRQKM